jgi:hypothetical protein
LQLPSAPPEEKDESSPSSDSEAEEAAKEGENVEISEMASTEGKIRNNFCFIY